MKKEYEATNYESDLTDEQGEAIKKIGSLRNVGVVKSICNRCKRLRINAATTASQPPDGLFPTAIPFSGTEYLLSIDLHMCPMQSI